VGEERARACVSWVRCEDGDEVREGRGVAAAGGGVSGGVCMLAWSRAAGGRSSSLRMPMTLLTHLGMEFIDYACNEPG
jgi:hypothetical protein